jgi:enterochelin esterase-like enzyme
MTTETGLGVIKESKEITSVMLGRTVKLDCFLPTAVEAPDAMGLLLINDGQDMEQLGFHAMINELYSTGQVGPLLCVGIYAGEDRKMEYGTANCLDFKGRGKKAEKYSRFVIEELIPFICNAYKVQSFKEKSFAGFSLGGLSALDIVWNHPETFTRVGVFSGSLWWRKKSIEEGYDENSDRIMHCIVREGVYKPWLKFFFQTGTEDETQDRNNNGIIDSIDDTLALIDELKLKGYEMDKDIVYLELEGGKHDVPTWAVAMPHFLKWGFGLPAHGGTASQL